MNSSRRDFSLASLSSLFALAAAQAAGAQEHPGQPLASFTTNYADQPPQDHGTSTFRPICDGIAAVGARVEVHETTLAPGAEPHPPHTHKHEEFLIMVRGRVEVTVDGKSAVLTPGGVGFWKSMALHHAKNVGTETAQYVIVSVGNDS